MKDQGEMGDTYKKYTQVGVVITYTKHTVTIPNPTDLVNHF